MAALFSTDDVRSAVHRWDTVPTPTPLASVIRSAILNALAFFDGHQESAAHALGISARALSYQMRAYGIPTSRTPAADRCAPRGRYAAHKLTPLT